MTKILIDLGEYDETPDLSTALNDTFDLISSYPDLALKVSEIVED